MVLSVAVREGLKKDVEWDSVERGSGDGAVQGVEGWGDGRVNCEQGSEVGVGGGHTGPANVPTRCPHRRCPHTGCPHVRGVWGEAG